MNNKREDLRIVKTKIAIKNSFIQLMKKKPFEKITVADITENALIHRGTFYSHYADKYDLLDKIENDIIEDMGQFIALIDYKSINYASENHSPLPHIIPLLTYIEDHPDHFYLIMHGNGNSPFFEKMVEKYFDQIMLSIQWPQDKWIDYRKDAAQSMITAILSRWVDNGMHESKEELASWLSAMMLSNWKTEKFDV